jgi:ribonuclease VapC
VAARRTRRTSDRCCLALAARLKRPAAAADTAWAALDLELTIRTIR